ncbi:MAG: hypothetical protein PHE09_11150 [Oscillospiraceae bacterium]|nr:hypothetical protein [Oscillospiraceae bacterium]
MYAQVLKSTMKVNLIGGASEGLPLEHELTYCLDIGDRKDISVGMTFDESTGLFSDPTPEEPLDPEIDPTPEERLSSIENENKLLKAQLQAQTDRSDFVEDCLAEMATLVYV